MTLETSVAMTSDIHEQLCGHLLRRDGQEDLCMAIYRQSTGRSRVTAVLQEVILPQPGERTLHGNVTFTGDYVLRVAEAAATADSGVVILHSHPHAYGWQFMSESDRDAESSYANLVREATGLPLIGITLAGEDRSWSARHWDHGHGREIQFTTARNVRVIGKTLDITWNDEIVPIPKITAKIRRTLSCWGPDIQASLARQRVLVVGVGSIGLDIVLRLAAAGVEAITLMDFDIVEEHNLDRLIGAVPRDVALRRPKTYVAHREIRRNATAVNLQVELSNLSICEPDGLDIALDHDLIFCCVDRPWPRAVLNGIAYSDLIPVIDGGMAIDTMPTGDLRNATWRSHVVAPGRLCLMCIKQFDPARVALERGGLLDDPSYINAHMLSEHIGSEVGQNVSTLSISAAASMLAQYTSLCVGPAGLGDPGPLQYLFSTHTLDHPKYPSNPHCPYENAVAVGDHRTRLTGSHRAAEEQRHHEREIQRKFKILRWIDERVETICYWLDKRLSA